MLAAVGLVGCEAEIGATGMADAMGERGASDLAVIDGGPDGASADGPAEIEAGAPARVPAPEQCNEELFEDLTGDYKGVNPLNSTRHTALGYARLIAEIRMIRGE